MDSEQLFGYIGDIDGNDGNLVAMDAVSRVGGQFFRYPASGGEKTSISRHDLDYVHVARPELCRRWAAGDIIWFAGRRLVTRSATDVVLRGFASAWALTPQGHRMRTGTVKELRVFRDRKAGELSVRLRKYLSDPAELSNGQAALSLEFYLAIENTAARRRFVNTALFYHEQRDFEAYRFECERAIRSGAFATFAEFESEWKEVQSFLREKRLNDVAQILPTLGAISHLSMAYGVMQKRTSFAECASPLDLFDKIREEVAHD